MLNELKRASPQATEDLERGIHEYLLTCVAEGSIGLGAEYVTALIVETRSHTVDTVRDALVERVDREAWKAAFKWANAFHSPDAPTSMVNALLGTAVAYAALADCLRKDEWLIGIGVPLTENGRSGRLVPVLGLALGNELV